MNISVSVAQVVVFKFHMGIRLVQGFLKELNENESPLHKVASADRLLPDEGL